MSRNFYPEWIGAVNQVTPRERRVSRNILEEIAKAAEVGHASREACE